MKKDILYRFFEGTASLEEEQQIREWMETSPENKSLFFKERKLFDAMTLLATDDLAVKRQIHSGRFLREMLKIASVILLTLTAGYFFTQYRQSYKEIAMQTIHVPSGQRVNLTLPDGTNVWLNARTTLKYPVTFSAKERLMELDGEAYFEVTENKEKPFIVKTSKGAVEVLGTDFNVESYTWKNDFETTLMRGSVKVTSAANEEKTVTLTPDNKAILRDGEFVVERVDDYTTYRWIEGLICFKNESFTSIMKDFEKYYGVTIKVKNRKIQQYHYTGKFRHTDGIDYALRVLQKDIYFTYSRDDENQIIYIE
ncbi:ferric-dicitrate binding protein FerR (iron transport regulator) [Parabacteroides sp. PF5-5]|uniref:FecR family protein n=1 Tax=unclassified Parabacteroides TaxID=2649774 RepID=UPI002476623E|nr:MULTISPECIES: FecR family protein [unclassified Parabacteroides]MDH6306455.1 ferric-dicitrate binding protein FerR (iron transport regulator) [Parabacteroides sp. PH5-39]MDH6317393.1 ferric-dicitrate binding protein FerR (iron transport regulator) [Parabacteroides sp. PF5-13]MDH6321166.1 ferric-dicitrate binding protein FerR (iron transport regulator) [Parabacteroides sp. PH5-13]MDH6324898.1 ferric-dicitrate binding protein FerR (iron transport regulator) [Parabacteroides sp. PH5-8]MDH63285